MTIEEAKAEALKVLQEGCPYPNGEAYIECWHENAGHGVRVSEYGWAHSIGGGSTLSIGFGGGSTFMASDNDGLAVCARLERLIIELIDGDADEIMLQAELLRMMLLKVGDN